MVAALRCFGREPGRLLHDVAVDFLTEAPLLLEAIAVALDRQSYEAAAGHAHRLRGTSGHMGALQLASAAGDLEHAAAVGDIFALRLAMRSVADEVARAMAAVGQLDF